MGGVEDVSSLVTVLRNTLSAHPVFLAQSQAEADSKRIDDDEEQKVVLIGESAIRDEADEEAEEEFNRDFAKMLADTTEATRKQERKTAPPVFDTAVPLIRKAKEEGKPSSTTHMQFSLLSKKGNKQQVSS